MKSTFSRVTLLGLAASLSSVAAMAAASGEVPIDFRPIRKNTFSFGFKVRNFGSSVKFSGLGQVDIADRLVDANGNKIYMDGVVGVDSPRDFEAADRIARGFTQLSPDGTRFLVYQTRSPIDASGTAGPEQLHIDPATMLPVQVGEGVSYVAGRTREWSAATTAQVGSGANQFVSFSDYGLKTNGATAEADSGSSTGVELAFERLMNKPHAKFQWGFGGAIGIADINAKTSKNIEATLRKRTDTYQFNGTIDTSALDPAASYSGQKINSTDYGDYQRVSPNGYRVTNDLRLIDSANFIVNGLGQRLNANNTVVDPTSSDPANRDPVMNDMTANPLKRDPLGHEVTVALNTNPSTTAPGAIDAGTAQVAGYWQIKGSYYQLKLGPNFRYMFNDRFAIAGRAGFSVNYIGSRFIVDERVTNLAAIAPGVRSLGFNTANTQLSDGTNKAENEINKFTFGGYVGLDAEYWVSDKTGFYAGLAYENLGSYKHTYRGRVAEIGSGSGTSYRVGIITRF